VREGFVIVEFVDWCIAGLTIQSRTTDAVCRSCHLFSLSCVVIRAMNN